MRPGESYLPFEFSWPVAEVIAEVCLRAGIPFDKIIIDEIEGALDGIPMSPSDPAYAVLESLGQIYLFDPSSFDGKLHFVPRGGDAVAALTEDDLIDENKEIKKLKRRDAIAVPKVLHLEYYDTVGGLNADKQTSDRSLDNRSISETKVKTRVIMQADDAARSVIITHKIGIEEQRGEFEFSLADSFAWLTTSDVITIDGERIRITECEIDDGVQNYKAVYDRASAYQSTVSGVPVQVPADPPSLIIGDTLLHFIDTQIIRDADDSLGYYIAVGRLSDGWNGALIELSIDGGQTYIDSVDVLVETTMGELLDPLPAHSVYYPDEINEARVQLILDDELETATLADVMNRANLALIGDELVNFMGADQLSDNEWNLSGWLRGRKNTAMVSHDAGERFILMERQYLFFINAELFELNRELTFRATSFGSDVSSTITATLTGQSQTERQVGYLQAERVDGDIVITWQAVPRLGGGVQVAHGAYFDGYRVTVNSTETDTIDQFLTVTDPGGSVTITVQQLNRLTGAGNPTTVTI